MEQSHIYNDHSTYANKESEMSEQPNVVAVALNNSALDLMRQGKTEEALNMFGNALREPAPARTGLGVGPSKLQDQTMTDSISLGDDAHVVQTRNADDPSSSSPDLKLPEKLSPSNFFTIFNRVVEISSVSPGDWAKYSAHVPAILLYNSGLAWHRVAFRENSDFKYKQAMENYNAAHAQLIYHASIGIYHSEVCDLLLLALCNNMGHVHSHFLRIEETRLCVEALFTVFFLTGNKRMLTKQEYVFFYMNILLTVNRMPVLAPAA